MVAGPEMARLITEFELPESDSDCVLPHHEQSPSHARRFTKDTLAMFSTLTDLGNPFEEDTKDLLSLVTK